MEEHLNAVRLRQFGSSEKVTGVVVAEMPCTGNHARRGKVTSAQNPSVSPHDIPVLVRSATAAPWLNRQLARPGGTVGLPINILPPGAELSLKKKKTKPKT